MKYKRKSHSQGFMLISFVIVLSLLMLGTLRSMAELGARQMAIDREMGIRRLADSLAFDCAYIWARIFQKHQIGGFEQFESQSIYLNARASEISISRGGYCTIRNISISSNLSSLADVIDMTADISVSIAYSGISATSILHLHIKKQGENSETIIFIKT